MLIAAAAKGSSTNLLPILLIGGVVLLYLIVIRPQRRKQKIQQSMQSELAVGDEVLTAGGVFGKVTQIDDDNAEVRVEIAPNVEVRLARRAIAAQLTEPDEPTEPTEDDPVADPETATAESNEEKPG